MNANQSPVRRSAGRPRYLPSPERRLMVARLHSFGMKQSYIALLCRISLPTLRKYFSAELSVPVPLQPPSLFYQANHGDARAAIFWVKTRCGWRTAQHEETTR
jgi:hypothetical protein